MIENGVWRDSQDEEDDEEMERIRKCMEVLKPYHEGFVNLPIAFENEAKNLVTDAFDYMKKATAISGKLKKLVDSGEIEAGSAEAEKLATDADNFISTAKQLLKQAKEFMKIEEKIRLENKATLRNKSWDN